MDNGSYMALRSCGPDIYFWYVCIVTYILEILPWPKVMTNPWVMNNNSVKYCPVRTLIRVIAWTWILTVFTLTMTLEMWPLFKVMTYRWVMDNNCVKFYPDPTWQWGVMDGTFEIMTFAQDHRQLCEMSWSNMAVRTDTDFCFLCTVTLTLEILAWLSFKVMTYPWTCVKYYSDPTCQ